MTQKTTMRGEITERVEQTAHHVQKVAELTTHHVTLDNVRKLEAETAALNDLLDHYEMMRSFGLLEDPSVTVSVPAPTFVAYQTAYS